MTGQPPPAAEAHRSSWRRATTTTFVGICLTSAVMLVTVPAWPGIFTIDSQAILADGIQNRVSNWYAPLHSWAWGGLHHFHGHPGVAFLLATSAVVAGLFAAYRLVYSSPSAGLATLATVVYPPIYGLLSWVGRDIWFLAYLLTVVAAMGWGLRVPQRRSALFGLALIAALLAIDARQNGLPLLLMWILVAALARPGITRRWLVVLPLVAAMTVPLALTVRAAIEGAVVQARLSPEQPLMLIDLTRMSVAAQDVLIPPEAYPAQDLELLNQVWGRQPKDRQTGILEDEDLGLRFAWGAPSGSPVPRAVTKAWSEAVRGEPLTYLSGRVDLYAAQLGASVPPRTVRFSWSDELEWSPPGLTQQHPQLNEYRLRMLNPTLDRETGFGGPIYTPWVYLVLGLVGAVVVIAREPVLRPLGWGLVAFQRVMQIGVFLSAPVAEYRYLHFQVVLGVLLAVTAVGMLVGTARTGIQPRQLPSSRQSGQSNSGEVVVPHSMDRPAGN